MSRSVALIPACLCTEVSCNAAVLARNYCSCRPFHCTCIRVGFTDKMHHLAMQPPLWIRFSREWTSRSNIRAEGRPVFVHCAHGHGRSTVVLSAALVAAGHADDVVSAYQIIRLERPGAHLNVRQLSALTKWEARWQSQLPRPQ